MCETHAKRVVRGPTQLISPLWWRRELAGYAMPSEKKLKKNLTLFDVYAVSTGAMFSSGFFLLPGIAASYTGDSVYLAYLLAGCVKGCRTQLLAADADVCGWRQGEKYAGAVNAVVVWGLDHHYLWRGGASGYGCVPPSVIVEVVCARVSTRLIAVLSPLDASFLQWLHAVARGSFGPVVVMAKQRTVVVASPFWWWFRRGIRRRRIRGRRIKGISKIWIV